jgi:hypothetical protein
MVGLLPRSRAEFAIKAKVAQYPDERLAYSVKGAQRSSPSTSSSSSWQLQSQPAAQ